jgi:starch synthase
MNILFIASEIDGLIKTGGLADVAYALPKALIAAGHDVRIIMPAYGDLRATWQYWPSTFFTTQISYFNSELIAARTGIHDGVLPIIAIEHGKSFDRPRLYDDGCYAYEDNPYRFAILSKAALDWCKINDWKPDIVQANDWQSALACFYLSEHLKDDSFFRNTRTVLSIHNGAYQMQCPAHWRDQVGINERFFTPYDFEDHGQLNILKGGIGFADAVVTVSPGYASELVTPTGGHGLDFKYRSTALPLIGILNGCDYDQWNPETDPWLPENYSSVDEPGKAVCKAQLQQELELESNPSAPLLASVCRLVEQKGIHLLVPVLLELMKDHDCQVAILGSGEENLANQLNYIQQQYPHRFRFINGYNVGLSHRIEAGADAFLMPSIFEPCGLNQIYSLRYGTVPLVREVGGLQDTVVRLSQSERNLKTATGFMFSDLNEQALLNETVRLLTVYRDKPAQWKVMQRNGMGKRFSWKKSAVKYLELYRSIMERPKYQHPLV